MNDISERNGKWFVVDGNGTAISEGYATEAEVKQALKDKAAAVAPRTGAPVAVAETAPVAAPVADPPAKPAPAAPKVRTTYLSESALFESATDAGVDVTLIRPGWSKNNRYYSKEALSRAADKFEGSKAYLDHPSKSDEQNRPERSVKDIAGSYSNVRQADDGRLVGTLHLLGENGTFIRPLIDAAIAGKPDLIGLSINALGKTVQGEAEGRKGIIVEDIAQANSTDIVTTPAAGGRFERLAASDDSFTADLLAAMDYDEWANARPEFLQRLRESMKALRQDEAIKEAQSQTTALREANATLETRNKELEAKLKEAGKAVSDMRAQQAQRDAGLYAAKLLKASHLPTGWQTTVQTQLLAEANTGLWPGLISAEQAKFASVRGVIPVQVAGAVTRQGANSVVSESLVPLPNESPEAYGRRMGYLKP